MNVSNRLHFGAVQIRGVPKNDCRQRFFLRQILLAERQFTLNSAKDWTPSWPVSERRIKEIAFMNVSTELFHFLRRKFCRPVSQGRPSIDFKPLLEKYKRDSS